MSFWLRYKTATGSTWTQMQFEGISILETIDVARINTETLRTNLVSHRKGSRRVWNIIISADETATAGSFLRLFWNADMQQISFAAAPVATVEGDGILVATDGGAEPLEYIDGLVHLKEYTFTLRESAGA